jgi:hypothetical protein
MRVTIYKIGKFDPVNRENSIFEGENSKLYISRLNWIFSRFN